MVRLKTDELRYQAGIRGWDQRHLARAARVSEATVSRALGGHPVRYATLRRLARALRDEPVVEELVGVIERGLGG